MSPDEEDAPLPRGQPLGVSSTGNLFFHLGADSGQLPCMICHINTSTTEVSHIMRPMSSGMLYHLVRHSQLSLLIFVDVMPHVCEHLAVQDRHLTYSNEELLCRE